jgi:hypothetical protein
MPAWVCDSARCPPAAARLADVKPDARERIRASTAVRASALRTVMISHARHERTLERISQARGLISRARSKP